ncbi:hypothetical protein PU560_09470 [Georgenia sp. 10Sc9-8]|uniref:CYTH domain-containing protein n=1 Tax=Georgenia halotolerans TaxID=3028317 RepID=A0ABT5TXA2_9MICO|nr:hypothetical protein [Georgenia halotolerans]
MSEDRVGDFEFERKFLVREVPETVLREPDPVLIVQSYFLAAEGYALRVRLQAPATDVQVDRAADEDELLAAMGEHVTFCALTAKGPYVGGTRYEAERELEPSVGLAMVRLGGHKVVKYRYSVWLGADGWAVDRFLGRSAGLIVAECEREGPVTDLVIPDFCITEITDDPRFGNDRLATAPYQEWSAGYEGELARRGPRFLGEFGHNRHGLASEL